MKCPSCKQNTLKITPYMFYRGKLNVRTFSHRGTCPCGFSIEAKQEINKEAKLEQLEI